MLWPCARRVKIEQLTHPSPLSILRGTNGNKIWLAKSNLIYGVTFMQWNSIVCSAASVSRDARPITWSYYTHTLGSGVRITAKVLYGWDFLTRAAWPYPFENNFVLLLYSCYKHRMKTPHASFPYSKGRQNAYALVTHPWIEKCSPCPIWRENHPYLIKRRPDNYILLILFI